MTWVQAKPPYVLTPRLGAYHQTVQREDEGWPRYTVEVYAPTLGEPQVAVYEHRHDNHQDRLRSWPASLAWVVLDTLEMVGGGAADMVSVFADEDSVSAFPGPLSGHPLGVAVDRALREGLTLGAYWSDNLRDQTSILEPRWRTTAYRAVLDSGDLTRLSAYEQEFRRQWLSRHPQEAITRAILESITEQRLRALA